MISGQFMLLPWLDEFRRRHPDVRFRLQLSDRMADVYRQQVDIAIRYGEPPDSSLIALPLAPSNRRGLCAAPEYLERRGTPASPRELPQHDCLCFMFGEDVHDRWRFMRDGEDMTVRVRSANVSNDGDAVRRWAVSGQGIAYKAHLDVVADLACGNLVALCTDWLGEAAPLYMICPDRRHVTPAVQLLREFIRQRCADTLSRTLP